MDPELVKANHELEISPIESLCPVNLLTLKSRLLEGNGFHALNKARIDSVLAINIGNLSLGIVLLCLSIPVLLRSQLDDPLDALDLLEPSLRHIVYRARVLLIFLTKINFNLLIYLFSHCMLIEVLRDEILANIR